MTEQDPGPSAAGTAVLVTVTGPDRPGVTSALLGVLTEHDVDVLDVEQVVIHDRLTLGVLVDHAGDLAALRASASAALTPPSGHAGCSTQSAAKDWKAVSKPAV